MIERDLLQVDREDIDDIAIQNYSMDESTGDQTMRESLRLQKKGDDFVLVGMMPGEAMNTSAMNLLLTKLIDLKIVSVLPKPAGITAMLTRPVAGTPLAQADVQDLGRKGFYLTRDGLLLSNEGEMIVHREAGSSTRSDLASGTREPRPHRPGARRAPGGAGSSGRESLPFIIYSTRARPIRRADRPKRCSSHRFPSCAVCTVLRRLSG